MKRSIKKYVILVFLLLNVCLTYVKADLKDYSGGGSGSAGNMSVNGEWTATYSGIKIGIVNKDNVLEDVEIILDSGLPNTMYFSYNNNPKMFQNSNITWEIESTNNYVSTSLVPDSWYDSNKKFINLDKWLSDNNYNRLKLILALKKNNYNLFPTLSSGDFIVVEPMTYIGGYFGTAYELGNAFLTLTDACYGEGKFCWNYSGLVFGGINSTKNTIRRCGGIFYNIIYLDEAVPALGLTVFNDTDGCNATKNSVFRDRNNCLKSNTCGRGIGVYEYNDIYTGSVEITKYITGTTNPISGAGFTLYKDSNCNTIISEEKTTNSSGKVVFSNLKNGTYYYKETTVPADFTGNTSCKSVIVSEGSKSTITAYNTQNPETGNLEINIKIKGTNKNILNQESQIEFSIYDGLNCQGNKITDNSTSAGRALIENLNTGTYSIMASGDPKGYTNPTPNYIYNTMCINNSYSIDAGKTTAADIFYDTTCSLKLENFGSNPTKEQLFSLFKEYPNNNNLLNLSNPSCSHVNCEDNLLSLNCLSGSTNTSSFNENNLSCYNDEPIIDNYGNYIGFCQTSYRLINNLGTNKFYGKAGRFLITQNENTITLFEKSELNDLIEKTITSESIATGIITKVCYSLNELNISNINKLPKYNIYFGDNNIDNEADQLQNISNIDSKPQVLTSNNLYKNEIIRTNNYSLNPLYLEKITGKYNSNKTNSTMNEPIFGILSRFDKENGIIPFKVNDVHSNLCTFETKKEIIIEDIVTPDEEIINLGLALEFRFIDTKEPFNRNTMSNWSDGTNNSKNNDVVKKYIKEAVNSYGLDKHGNKVNPLYKIILTSNDIKIIRDYNKTISYDNYLTEEVAYNENKVIRNSFLYNLESGKLNDNVLSEKLYNSKYPN